MYKIFSSTEKRSLAVLSSALFMLIIVSSFAAASGQPQIPYSLYGSATLNGDPLPAGSVITAFVSGIEAGSYTTVIQGKYGGSTPDDGKLYVMKGENGDAIEFYVKSPTMHSKVKALQEAVWKTGEIDRLNLDFTGQDMVSYFYGNAIIDGNPAPVNSVITAEINGIVHGSITIASAGKYGSLEGEKLRVYDGINNDEVKFFLKTPGSSTKREALEKGVWKLGETAELNLNFAGDEKDEDPVSSFYGAAVYDGDNAPVGSVITAEIDGITRGSITIITEGLYGSENGAKLDVYNGASGDTIHFFIMVPGVEKKVEAGTTSTWIENRTRSLTLIFTPTAEPEKTEQKDSEPITQESSKTPSTGDGAGDDKSDSDASQTGSVEVEDTDNLLFDSEDASVKMKKGDIVSVIVGGNRYNIEFKSLSDFGILLVAGKESIVLGKGETKGVDLDGDEITDISITLDDIENGIATLKLIKLKSELKSEGSVSGMITTGINMDTATVAVAAVIVLALAGGIFAIKRRGRRFNERGFKSYSF